MIYCPGQESYLMHPRFNLDHVLSMGHDIATPSPQKTLGPYMSTYCVEVLFLFVICVCAHIHVYTCVHMYMCTCVCLGVYCVYM